MIVINIIVTVKKEKTSIRFEQMSRWLFHGDGAGLKIFEIHANLRDLIEVSRSVRFNPP